MNRRLASLALIALALAPATARASAKADGEKKKKSGSQTYIEMDAVTATIIRPDGHRGVLMVETGIDTPNIAFHDKALLVLPRLRAAYAQTVQIYGAGLAPGLPPNLEYLSRELQRQTDETLGMKGARFLLGSVMVN